MDDRLSRAWGGPISLLLPIGNPSLIADCIIDGQQRTSQSFPSRGDEWTDFMWMENIDTILQTYVKQRSISVFQNTTRNQVPWSNSVSWPTVEQFHRIPSILKNLWGVFNTLDTITSVDSDGTEQNKFNEARWSLKQAIIGVMTAIFVHGIPKGSIISDPDTIVQEDEKEKLMQQLAELPTDAISWFARKLFEAHRHPSWAQSWLYWDSIKAWFLEDTDTSHRVAQQFEALVRSILSHPYVNHSCHIEKAKRVVSFFAQAINLRHPVNPWQPSPHSEMPDWFYEITSGMWLLATQGDQVLITELWKEIAQRVQKIFE